MSLAQLIVAVVGYASLVIAAGYSIVVLTAVLTWRSYTSRPRRNPAAQTPVTILKPLCGDEPGLYEHLRSFCQQQYSQYQVVFGTLDAADPALAVVARLIQEFPQLPIDLVVNPQRHGNNNKNGNLINMLVKARHPVLVIADSDISVNPDYLATVTAPLQDAGVGLVTCLSHDAPTAGLWSRLGAMYVNEWYFPSVMFAWLFGYQDYASGQTLCLRRTTLEAIPADSVPWRTTSPMTIWLGQLIRARGLRIVLSPYEVQAGHYERDLASLSRHEVRWMRTLHIVRPWRFWMIFLTFGRVLALIGIALTAQAPWHAAAWTLFGVTAMARCGLHIVHRLRTVRPLLEDIFLVPIRDVLLFWLWGQTLFSRRVTWRGARFDVDTAGVMRRIA